MNLRMVHVFNQFVPLHMRHNVRTLALLRAQRRFGFKQ